ncbi:hypothetical protein BASA81_005421 [Batrachochytrium salamandrivorans]|nr:hypothetical protein BASA81_005421 [Batrachochytrium salamandrivorans]
MAENITEEQLHQYMAAFSHFDKDNNGSITIHELRLVVDELGHKLTDTELGAMMMEMDSNNNGSIDFSEFLAMMAKRMLLSDVEQEMLESFQVLDADGDGVLSLEELHSLLTTLGDKLSAQECAEILRLADTNGDGRIDYKEFVKLLLGGD